MRVPSIFSILKAGLGPSSSHTLGPVLAAGDFRQKLAAGPWTGGQLQVVLQGSLARTGKGHLTDVAVTAGLAGFLPNADPHLRIQTLHQAVRSAGKIRLPGKEFAFFPETDIVLDLDTTPLPHPNTLQFRLLDDGGRLLLAEEYHSIGGGRVTGGAFPTAVAAAGPEQVSMSAIVDASLEDGHDLEVFVLENERTVHGLSSAEVTERLRPLWEMMTAAIDRGLKEDGLLPGRLKLQRRASGLFIDYVRSIREWRVLSREITLAAVYAIAVAEENAAGGRIVTAPTCGSAGIVPATLKMLQERFRLPDERILSALMVAGLVGTIVAANGSISGAEAGCQAEVGTASAMAAAAACHLLGGNVLQVESAAETALEHHLGLTCDPIYGLVQIPCIERNAVGSVTALNAANLALLSPGGHRISLDTVVATLRQVGQDMNAKYKETALGGLAAAKGRIDSDYR